jgi:hypothetical protein
LKAGAEKGTSKAVGTLLYILASKSTVSPANGSIIAQYIGSGKISSQQQLTAALDYMKTNEKVDIAEFEKFCGVGIKLI